jgi:hypothetical protein
MSLAASPNEAGIDRNWNVIWKQPVPHKVRSFLWHASHCCLPTRTRLNQKGVQREESCVNFEVLAEMHIHFIFV